METPGAVHSLEKSQVGRRREGCCSSRDSVGRSSGRVAGWVNTRSQSCSDFFQHLAGWSHGDHRPILLTPVKDCSLSRVFSDFVPKRPPTVHSVGTFLHHVHCKKGSPKDGREIISKPIQWIIYLQAHLGSSGVYNLEESNPVRQDGQTDGQSVEVMTVNGKGMQIKSIHWCA